MRGAKKRRFVLIVLFFLLVASLGWQAIKPRVYMELLILTEQSEWVVSRLAACGPRAAPAMIDEIMEWGPERPRVAGIIRALGQSGEGSRATLLRSIDAQPDPARRATLIEILMWSFHDYSRLGEYLREPEHARNGASRLIHQFRSGHLWEDVPNDVLLDGKVNPDFERWYAGKVRQGLLPAVEFSAQSRSR